MQNSPIILITDVDGVFTDGSFYYNEEGKIMKKFGAHDSDGIKIIRNELNIQVIAITGDHRGYQISKKRLDDMKIKLNLVSESERFDWIKKYGFENVIYVGDGYYDAPVLDKCKYSYAPDNAVPEAKMYAKLILDTCGGCGVFLEIALHLKYKGIKNERII